MRLLIINLLSGGALCNITRGITDFFLQPKTLKLFHPDSPGVYLSVKRTIIGRFFKPKNFATLNEALKDHKNINNKKYKRMVIKILKNKEILPLLIGIDKDLDNMIHEEFQK